MSLILAGAYPKCCATYTLNDQQTKPVGKNIDEAVEIAEELVRKIRGYLSGYDWKAELEKPHPRAFLNATTGATDYLRSQKLAQKSDDDEPSL
ncbi:hypothetical protein, partial [Macrococcoides canis]